MPRNSTHASTNGTNDERTIAGMFLGTLVPVNVATSSELVETGEHRSPKYDPERTAPPVSKMGTPALVAMNAQIVPMVTAVPNEVPVRNDMRQHSRNVASKTTGPEHIPEVISTM